MASFFGALRVSVGSAAALGPGMARLPAQARCASSAVKTFADSLDAETGRTRVGNSHLTKAIEGMDNSIDDLEALKLNLRRYHMDKPKRAVSQFNADRLVEHLVAEDHLLAAVRMLKSKVKYGLVPSPASYQLLMQALVDKNLPKGAIATLDLAVAHHGKLSSWPDLVTVSTVGRTYTVSKQAAIQRSPALKAYLSEHGKNLPDLKEQWAAYLAATAGQPASQGADNDVARRACLDLLGTATVLAGCLANHGVACKLALGAGDDLPPQLQLIKSCLVHRDFLNGMRFAGKLRRAQADSESTEAELLAICAEAAEDDPAYSAESMAALIGVGRTTAIGAGAVEVTIRGAKLSKSATNGDLRRFVDDFEHYPHTLRRGPDEASLTFASAEEAARAVDELSGKALMGVDVELEVAQADAPEEDEGEVQDK